MAARRYPTSTPIGGAGAGVSDRHAMLSAYGYSYPSTTAPSQQRTSSPFENPYTSTSNSTTSGPSSYDTKKHDDKPSSSSSSTSWWPGNANKASDLQASMLEEQNDQRLQGLSDRVAVLKSITIGIGNEVVEGTKDLNSLGDAMSNARDFLGGTVKRMNHMARRQGGWFCNMMMFLLFVCWLFVFLWWWRR